MRQPSIVGARRVGNVAAVRRHELVEVIRKLVKRSAHLAACERAAVAAGQHFGLELRKRFHGRRRGDPIDREIRRRPPDHLTPGQHAHDRFLFRRNDRVARDERAV